MSDQCNYSEHNKNDSIQNHHRNSCHVSRTTTTTTSIVSNFPAKLHFMLNDLKRDGLEYIASWQKHGRCFIVKNPKEFENTILPCYFQQSKFTSFQRQLSFYGFRRIVSGRDKGGYFHEKFIRGKEELSINIQRKKIKGTGPRKPNSMELPTPNFYDMPFLPENTEKNSNIDSKSKRESSKTTHDSNTQVSSTKTFEVNIPEGSTRTDFQSKQDYKEMIWKRQQEQLHQLQLLTEKERDSLFISLSSPTMQNYMQSRKSSQSLLSNLYGGGHIGLDCRRGMGLSSSSTDDTTGYPVSIGSIFPSQSLLGLNYPLSASSITLPLSSYRPKIALPFPMEVTPSSANTADVIRFALEKYYQNK